MYAFNNGGRCLDLLRSARLRKCIQPRRYGLVKFVEFMPGLFYTDEFLTSSLSRIDTRPSRWAIL